MRLKKHLSVAFAIAVLAAVVAINYAAMPSAYVLYTSPPLDAKGTRVEFLIPRGWRALEPTSMSAMGYRQIRGTYLNLFPTYRADGVLRWLQSLTPARTDHASFSYFSSRADAEKFDADIMQKQLGIQLTHLSRIIDLPDGKAARVAYSDQKRNHESIAEPILRSFRIKPAQ